MNPTAASPPYDRRTDDIGNLVEFGHVNLHVPDQALAIVFYVMGLGLTRDPFLRTGIDNAWINVGRCQFHLPTAAAAQVLAGTVHLVMPDLDALQARLAAVAPLLAGSAFAFARREAQVDAVCPWGNRVRVHAPDARRFGAMELGMPCVEIDAPPGAATRIAAFYETVFASPATIGHDEAGAFARIPVGLSESLLYRESSRPRPLYDGHHVQVTVADFSGVHRRLLARGLITEESDAHQYRFQDIVDVDSGEPILALEHEVRSMRHPLYARPLVNRPQPARDR